MFHMTDPHIPKVQVTFSISVGVLALLDQMAREERRSRSDMVRIAVDEYIDRQPSVDALRADVDRRTKGRKGGAA